MIDFDVYLRLYEDKNIISINNKYKKLLKYNYIAILAKKGQIDEELSLLIEFNNDVYVFSLKTCYLFDPKFEISIEKIKYIKEINVFCSSECEIPKDISFIKKDFKKIFLSK